MIHSVAFVLGYLLMILVGLVAASLLIVGATKLINRAIWALVDCYGGIRTFRDYVRWYQQQRDGAPHA